MACCGKKTKIKNKMWRNLNYVRRLARHFTKVEKKDTQKYRIDRFYNFEPIKEERKNIIEYIRHK